MSVDELPPLAVAIPLVAAAICVGAGSHLPRRVVEIISIAAAATTVVLCALLCEATVHGTVVHWFGGWLPRAGVALGIAFAVDTFGAGLATLCAVLTTVAFVFAWRYYAEGGPPFNALMLVFLAAMLGFVFTGDIFNMFVFFELMGVAAFALTAFRTEDEAAVEGGFNFAILNSAGAFLVLIGIALVYGRTGALNMAQIGHALSGPPDRLIIIAFVLIVTGFAVKAAVAPFHFWLPDAHAVAPTPLCLLFSGIMVQLGLYAILRVYWTVFETSLGWYEATLRDILMGLGVITAIVGSFMCWAQRHLKRLLAFSTVAHSGTLLIAIATFSPTALGGFWIYVMGHGLVKGALFLCSGVYLHRFASLDQNALRGRGAQTPFVTAMLVLGALGLAGFPPFATTLGKSLVDDGLGEIGWTPMVIVTILVSVVTAGAVLRAAGIIGLGWGPQQNHEPATPAKEQPETQGAKGSPVWMLASIAALLAIALALGSIPQLGAFSRAAAERLTETALYHETVLGIHPAIALPDVGSESRVPGIMIGLSTALLALLVAGAALGGTQLAGALRAAAAAVTRPLMKPLHLAHDGVVIDYVAWLAAGTVILAGATIAACR